MKYFFAALLSALSFAFYGQTKSAKNDSLKNIVKQSTKAIKTNPSNAIAYKARAKAKLGLEDYKGALKDYDKAIELNPKYDSAYVGRGVAKKN